MQTPKIHVSPIHHVERARFDRQLIQNPDIVGFPVGDPYETRDIASQIDERVQLDRPFLLPERRSGKQAQAQIDCGAIQGVHSLLKFDSDRFVRIHFASAIDQHLSEIRVNSPVVRSIGVSQSAAGDVASEACMIELGLQGSKACFNVAQALTECQLCEGEAKKLVSTREATWATIPLIPSYARIELMARQEIHELSEDESTRFHESSSAVSGKAPEADLDDSTRYRARPKLIITDYIEEGCVGFSSH